MSINGSIVSGASSLRLEQIYQSHHERVCRRTDQMFAVLMLLQWLGAIIAALVISPRTWIGQTSYVHLHLWAAIFLGGAISSLPIGLAVAHPGKPATRYAMTVAQMLMSSLLIHLTGGRIETHFHIFGSLALLAFYRDWRVLIIATIVVCLDHAGRGIFFPQSVFGVVWASQWRWAEHASWVAFMDVFLVIGSLRSQKEMREIARRTAELTDSQARLRTYAARLEQSNRELQDFAYIASHDLQEPLRKVQAFGDRLDRNYAAQLGDDGRDYLRRMRDAAGRMQTLISDLLTFSRITSKGQPFVRADLAQITDGVISDLEVRIEQTGAKVDVGSLPAIDADPTQMRQLMQNLIGNGLKFHRKDDRPRVSVSAELVRPTANGSEGHETWSGGPADAATHCRIAVQDHGIGFDEKHLDRIFAVFQRLHGRGEYEGSGVGLAVCRKIAERHHGTITARSTPGAGATFVVTLPIAHARELVNETQREIVDHSSGR